MGAQENRPLHDRDPLRRPSDLADVEGSHARPLIHAPSVAAASGTLMSGTSSPASCLS